jgi:lysozyme
MDTRFVILAAIAALIILRSARDPEGTEGIYQDEDLIDGAQTTWDETVSTITETFSGPSPIASMSTSQSMLDMLKQRERLEMQPYNLGDGGWTVGYGHFEKTREALPVLRTQADAEALFASDVQERGEKWVKLYVKVDLTQQQFDALVSIAFNMSPQSFKKFAEAVNNGEGINTIAQRSIAWVADKFKNGIANRRTAELNVFNNGVYA